MTCACGKELHMRRFVGGEIQCKQCCRRYDSRGYQLAAPPPPTVALPDFSPSKPTRFAQRGKRIPHKMTKEEATEIYLSTPVRKGRQTERFRQARQLLTDLGETRVLKKRKLKSKNKAVPWTPKELPGFEMVPETMPVSVADGAQLGIPEMPQMKKEKQKPMSMLALSAMAVHMNNCPQCGINLSMLQTAYELTLAGQQQDNDETN